MGEQIVQVRIPGARRTYPYTWDGPELKVGDWVELPGNAVSPEGTEGRVEGFGADGYTGPMKAVTAVKPPQDPWTARMRQIKTKADAQQVYRRAKTAGVTGDRLAALVAEGKRVLAERENTAPTKWAGRVLNKPVRSDGDFDASTVAPPLTSAEDASESQGRRRREPDPVYDIPADPAYVPVSVGRVDATAKTSGWGEWE